MTELDFQSNGVEHKSAHCGLDPRASVAAALLSGGFVGISSECADLFTPEATGAECVAQASGVPYTSLHILQREVLLDAIRIIQRGLLAENRRHRGLHAETCGWVMAHDEDDEWPMSFRNICEALNLSESYLRKWIRIRIEEHVVGQDRLRRRIVAGTRTRVTGKREMAWR